MEWPGEGGKKCDEKKNKGSAGVRTHAFSHYKHAQST